jgi:predicted DsbA family dithiol-disulfide isomerase
MVVYWQDFRSICEGSSGGENCRIINNKDKELKPIEIYVYIDPIYPQSWGLEVIIKKLVIEYGNYFTIRYIIGTTQATLDFASGKKSSSNSSGKWVSLTGLLKDNEILSDEPASPYKAAIAIKTAELQGKGAGMRFLRNLHEQLYLNPKNILSNRVLLDCAAMAKLDVDEFKKDFISKSPVKALLCDQQMMAEMDVTELPALVLFNVQNDKEGVKITGNYPYQVYVQILTEALGEKPYPRKPPELKDFIRKFQFVETKEISIIYDMPEQEAIRELKKLKLKQLVEPITIKSGMFWRYSGS